MYEYMFVKVEMKIGLKVKPKEDYQAMVLITMQRKAGDWYKF